MVAPGRGMRGCSRGVCMFFAGGHMYGFFQGGMRGFSRGGMRRI